MLNAINPAMDGTQNIITPATYTRASRPVANIKVNEELNDTAQSLAKEMEQTKASVQQLQNISNALGKKLQFNVNEALGKVVVKVIDPSTDKVIKEIPSADVQQLQIKIREAFGLLVDEKI
jgi:flagellar protein FlaG